MANADNEHSGRGAAAHRGDQGEDGIDDQVTKKERRESDPAAGEPDESQGGEPVSVPTRQLPREDGDEVESESGDDDGQHVSAGTHARPQVLTPELVVAPEGGVGRRSGTGQAKTHRSFDENEGRQSLGRLIDPDSELPEPRVGDSYQSGGRR